MFKTKTATKKIKNQKFMYSIYVLYNESPRKLKSIYLKKKNSLNLKKQKKNE